MREILFRGKQVDNGEWIQGDLLQNVDCLKIREQEKDIKHIARSFVVHTETIGQYTGLTDKNGTKIFEGDILIYTDKDQDKSTHKVFWSDTRLAFYACYTRYPELYGYASNFNKDDIEVIGNIHDNPELLKGGIE